MAGILPLVESAGRFDRSKYHPFLHSYAFLRGLSEFRRGRWERAIAQMRGDVSGVLATLVGLYWLIRYRGMRLTFYAHSIYAYRIYVNR